MIKSDIYDHLQSQLKSKTKTFSPRSFIRDFVPDEYRTQFREHLETESISLSAFTKDTCDIATKLQRRTFQTTKGGMISVPVDLAEIVEVRTRDILVKDTVSKVK